jgi:leucyl/phenylalanyl-tRNA---protein transferase
MRGGTVVPDPNRVVACPELMGGVCRNISADTILEASRFGFDPWCHYGPLKWWTRDMRMVLFFNEHHIGKNLRHDMRNKRYSVTFDEAFEDVVKACASSCAGDALREDPEGAEGWQISVLIDRCRRRKRDVIG